MTTLKKHIKSAPPGRPVTIKKGRNITLHLDEITIIKAQIIGSENISEGVRIAVNKFKIGEIY